MAAAVAAADGAEAQARTASPLLRPVVLYVKITRITWMAPPGACWNHPATSWSEEVKGRPRNRTYDEVMPVGGACGGGGAGVCAVV